MVKSGKTCDIWIGLLALVTGSQLFMLPWAHFWWRGVDLILKCPCTDV